MNIQIRDHLLSFFALLFITFLFLLPAFLEDRTLIDSADIYNLVPWNTVQPAQYSPMPGLDGSPSYLFHPSDLLARNLVRRARGFAWNPYIGLGAPWIGAMQGSPYFPPKVLEYILPFWEGANLVRILLLLAAGLGSYLLAVSLGLDQAAALVSAASYMFCQRLFLIINMPAFHVETLLPLMLFGIHRMVVCRSFRYAIFAGWIGASQFLGGMPETSFIFCLLSASFFVFLISQAAQRTRWKSNVALGIIVLAITLLISGFQLGEFIRYLSLAQNAHSSFYGSVVKSPTDLIRVFVPYYFGLPFESQWTSMFGLRDHMYLSLFSGVITVVLALIALIGSHPRRGRWFFLAALTVFLGYDYGFPGFTWIGHLPFFRLSSIAWNAFVIPFNLSMLAGFGMHAVLNGDRIWKKVSIAVAACIILLAFLMSRFPSPSPEAYATVVAPGLKWFLFGLLGFLVSLAWLRHERYKWVTPWLVLVVLNFELYHADTKLGFLRLKSYAANPPALDWFLKTSPHDRILGLGGVFPADTLLPSRVRDVRHFDAMYPKLYVDYVDAIWPGARTNVYDTSNPSWQTYDSKLLDVAAVRYIFSPKELQSSQNLIDVILAKSSITTFDRRLVNTSGFFEINGDKRRVLFQHPPATIDYQVKVPVDGQLLFAIGEEPKAWPLQGEGTIFEIAVAETRADVQVKYHRFYDPKHNPADRNWIEGKADLSAYAGKTVNVLFITKSGANGTGPNANAWDGWADVRWGPEKFTRVYSDASTYIYKNNKAVDRARFVPGFRDANEKFSPGDMASPSFDMRDEVFLSGYKPPASAAVCPADWAAKATIEAARDDPDTSKFRVSAPCDGFFVLADLYYPGWTATVDGAQVPIYNANYAFRALPLKQGRHEIAFRYVPWTISIGVPLAFLTIVGSSLMMIPAVANYKPRRKLSQPLEELA